MLALILDVTAALAVEPGALSITAEGVTATRAIFHMHPDANVRNDDYMAMAMVHPAYWHYSSMTDDFDDAFEVIRTFRWTSPFFINARAKHIDDILKQAAVDGIGQVVNLGAGYDSRAYRYRKAMPNVRFFEVDLPGMVLEKQRRLKEALGHVPDYVTFVPIDFNKQTLKIELNRAGYTSEVKTLFIWEGVTMYISGEAVASTLKFIATNSAPGSSVVYDYMPLAIIDGDFKKYADMRGLAVWVQYRGEPFVFGIPEGEGAAYVEAHGLEVLSNIGALEMEARYLTRSDGTLDGKCASGFRIMHAAVPSRQEDINGLSR
jgi:methyltransferase (TIGR00027 family)